MEIRTVARSFIGLPILLIAGLVLNSELGIAECGKYVPEAPAQAQFDALTDAQDRGYGLEGWKELTGGVLGEDFEFVQAKGKSVAILAKDNRFKGGLRFILGYVYDHEVVSTKKMPVKDYLATLSPQERREFNRQRRPFVPDTEVVVQEVKVRITSTPPTYEFDFPQAGQRRKSVSWPREPREEMMTDIFARNIVSAKYLTDNP